MLWKTITSQPEFEISENGDVRRIGTTKCRKAQDNGHGYKLIQFRKKGTKPKNRLIHRMVALEFIGPPPSDAHVVAHNDGNPENNAAWNLRWATPKENAADRLIHGTSARGIANPKIAGERHGNAKLTTSDILSIRSDRRPAREIASIYKVTPTHVRDIRRLKTWKHVA